jgi:hypothetical protein
MIYGIDYLLVAKFKKLALENHPAGFAAGYFWEEGGPIGDFPDRLFTQTNCPMQRIQALWDADHIYGLPRQETRMLQIYATVKALKSRFPNKEVQFSPYCEHDLNAAKVRALFTMLKDIGTGGVTLVNSVNKGALIQMPGVINEIHNIDKNPPPGVYNHSFDGTDAFGVDMDAAKHKYRRAACMFFWCPAMNLKKTVIEKPFIPPLERTYRPKAVHIISMADLQDRRGKTRMVPKGILKPLSEDTAGDKKANKVCIIVPGKYEQVEFRTPTELYILPWYGLYKDGRHRYYSRDYAYEISKQLSMLPCRLIGINKDGTRVKLGRVHPSFRCGDYRDE